MKLDKLARQLRRDLLASPKKAAALGLMVLVALYFWAPMVWGWLAPSKGAKPAARVADLILEDEPVAATSSGVKSKKGFRWEKARQQMASDRRMATAALGENWRNPFQNQVVTVRPEETAEGEIVHVPVLPPDIHPSTAGLVLRSVLMGPRGRAAAISGEVYREGELVVAGEKTETNTPLEFRLLRVTRYAVELERNGRTFWLEFERTKMAKGDAITSD